MDLWRFFCLIVDWFHFSFPIWIQGNRARKTIQVFGFQHLIPAEEVKKFLEEFTGEGTVVALQVEIGKQGGQRAYARVQFTSTTCAETIVKLATNNLSYGASYLKAKQLDVDMVHHVRTYLHEMEDTTLNLGCQISDEAFSVLWKVSSVSVKFETGLKSMHFLFCCDSIQYRFQLQSENVGQIVLYYQPDHTVKLFVQLLGAPRIYYKNVDDTAIHRFYKDTTLDDQWIRTTDFTESSCIGQSSGLCLEVPSGVKFPNFKDSLPNYLESVNPFHLERGLPFCRPSALVPIISPPQGVNLPYNVLFKVCSLVQKGCIPGPKLDANFFRLINPEHVDVNYIEHALEKLYYLKECCYHPSAWLLAQYEKYQTLQENPKSPAIQIDNSLVYVRRVQVTPTKIYFLGPEVNTSNRVLRHYKEHMDNFLRVSFVDEELEKMFSTDLCSRLGGAGGKGWTKLFERVLSTLKDGIRIGDKKFDFLAFSSSQIRENSLWMFSSTPDLNADDIRRWMGEFHSIRNVAKYSARLGQSFGSSIETFQVGEDEVEQLPDIVTTRRGTKYIFSDGIGKISAEFAQRVALKCRLRDSTPSAFQIRYGGYKGVVAVDPNSQKKLSLRPSMLKYQSKNTKLDVLAWSKYHPCFLNRQIVTLLSTLGVEDEVFENKQREEVAQLDEVLVDPLRAQEALDLMLPGETTTILKEMLKCGYMPTVEPFLSMMLHNFRSSKLLDLRVKARIFVPKGRKLMGCLDETGTLKYGQVFVQLCGSRRHGFDETIPLDGTPRAYNCIIKGKVVVAKNPCLHPGDVRVLEAINVDALHHMVDCLVFPSTGQRPHPNECSGSDLDGDIYFVSWDPDLIPPRQYKPMNYNPAPNTVLDHDVTIEEIVEYFTGYSVNDSLGIIANAHTVFADREPLKALSRPCLDLANLFSVAVDFPKTGVPAEIPSRLRVREYPDFMEKPNRRMYESYGVIGKLFREVKYITSHTARPFTKEVARIAYDLDMEVEGFEEYLKEASEYKTEYDYKLGNLMEYYGIKTEAEILSGSLMTFDRSKDVETIGAAVRSLRNQARSWFKRGITYANTYPKASAWYHVTYHPDFWGSYNEGLKRDHYLSFPWCVYDKLMMIKKDKSRDITIE